MNRHAPSYPVSSKSVVSVEHPCLVRDADKAIDMLGGPRALAEAVEKPSDVSLSLSFRPDDAASRSVMSLNNSTNNLLLKVTVPKRTGRKRKRGSDDPFVPDSADSPVRKDANYLIQSLQDNTSKYTIEPLGIIQNTHIWRTMPDFVYSTRGSSFLDNLRTKILPQKYALMNEWSLPRTYGLADTETVAPPVFSTQGLPHNYTYRQNPAVKSISDPVTGRKKLQNTQAPMRIYTYQCQHDDAAYPSEPHPLCHPISEQTASLQKLREIMDILFKERPIWTRRALLNHLPDEIPTFLVRQALAYIAFILRSGPWRDTMCRLGFDPRKDRSARRYQSVLIQLVSRDKGKADTREDFTRPWVRSKDKTSHIFTGEQEVPPDGKVWQLCDLEDPQLKALVDIPDVYVRSTCETRYFGWYANGTMSKIRVILKAKVDALNSHEPLDEPALDRFLRLPEQWDGQSTMPREGEMTDLTTGYLPKTSTKKELEWASAYRSLCRTKEGALPITGGGGKGRLTKSKPSTRSSFLPSSTSARASPDSNDLADTYGEPEDGDSEFDGTEIMGGIEGGIDPAASGEFD